MTMIPSFPTDNFIKFLTLLTLAGSIYCFTLLQEDSKAAKAALSSYDQRSMLSLLLRYKIDHADLLNNILPLNTKTEREQAIVDFKWNKDTVYHSTAEVGIAYEVLYIDTTKEIVISRLKSVIDDIQDIEKKMIFARPDNSIRESFWGHLIATVFCFISFNFFAARWFYDQKKHDRLLDLQIRKLELELPPAQVSETTPDTIPPSNPEKLPE